jgi:hypothetical protein
MSGNVLDTTGSHTHVDGVESFYYAICWILVTYDGPGNWKAELPKFIALWDEPKGIVSLKFGTLTPNSQIRSDS